MVVKLSKFLFLSVLVGVTSLNHFTVAQNGFEEYLYKISNGDKKALYEIAPYLDSSRLIRKGFHMDLVPINIHIYIKLRRYTDFPSDSVFHSGAEKWVNFLNQHSKEIHFAKDAGRFVLSDYSNWTLDTFMLMRLTEFELNEYQKKKDELLDYARERLPLFDSLYRTKSPEILRYLAASVYKSKSNFTHEGRNYLQLLRGLSTFEVYFKHEYRNIITSRILEDYGTLAQKNLIFYAAQRQFTWNDHNQTFVNENLTIEIPSIEKEYFEMLLNKDSEYSNEAYDSLAVSNPEMVKTLVAEFESMHLTAYHLQRSWVRDLSSISQFTEYCRRIGIEYHGSYNANFINLIDDLDGWISMEKRKGIEDTLIRDLNFSNVTQFEFEITTKKLHGTNMEEMSANQILDIFYTDHWDELISNADYLKLYLIKSSLLPFCREKYLCKFTRCSDSLFDKMEVMVLEDSIAISQLHKAISIRNFILEKELSIPQKFNDTSAAYCKAVQNAIARIEQFGVHPIINDQLNYPEIYHILEYYGTTSIFDRENWDSLRKDCIRILEFYTGMAIGEPNTFAWSKEVNHSAYQSFQWMRYIESTSHICISENTPTSFNLAWFVEWEALK